MVIAGTAVRAVQRLLTRPEVRAYREQRSLTR
jgi:hypothetical protein